MLIKELPWDATGPKFKSKFTFLQATYLCLPLVNYINHTPFCYASPTQLCLTPLSHSTSHSATPHLTHLCLTLLNLHHHAQLHLTPLSHSSPHLDMPYLTQLRLTPLAACSTLLSYASHHSAIPHPTQLRPISLTIPNRLTPLSLHHPAQLRLTPLSYSSSHSATPHLIQ